MNKKYYLAVVQNGTTPALFTYDTLDGALAAFHTEMAYRAAGRTSTKCALMNEELEVIKRESYYAATESEESLEE
ncbi:hypothetical protein [uncultured Ruminococcus sp.]|uniref:hypothetical protein n=1 Tax=uncultured Ruminococcus sp. TaxID=165186 RepID=UPI0025DF37EF|nr:hypothetical protein [uncultured Ruminococcus sp.]